MASPVLRLREESLSGKKCNKKQWDTSTKLNESKKTKAKSPIRNGEFDAHSLVARAVDQVLSSPISITPSPRSHSSILPTLYIKEIEEALQEDQKISENGCIKSNTPSSYQLELHFDQIHLEKTHRKIKIQAFQREIERKIQQLQEMAIEIQKRELIMDTAFEQYENLIRCQQNKLKNDQ